MPLESKDARSRVGTRPALVAPLLAIALLLLFVPTTAFAESPEDAASIVEQWRDGLRGALLTSYSGSVISSNSSLTTLRLCSNGRFRLDRDASWNAGGAAAGASQGVVTGTWGVEAQGLGVVVTYQTDTGDQGAYPVYLQPNGRVNLGGVAYAAQRGGAGC